MLVTVRLFARLREIGGGAEIRMELTEGSTAADAWRTLTERHPDMEAYSSSISCAVNEDYARMSAPLGDGDEVAFLPPVSGGEGSDLVSCATALTSCRARNKI